MKLIGSLVEEQFRKELTRSWTDLTTNQEHITSLLTESLQPVKAAFILNWTPEQFEDIYTILVNEQYVITLEIYKDPNTPPSITTETKAEYERSLKSKHKRIQLAVAVTLSNELCN